LQGVIAIETGNQEADLTDRDNRSGWQRMEAQRLHTDQRRVADRSYSEVPKLASITSAVLIRAVRSSTHTDEEFAGLIVEALTGQTIGVCFDHRDAA
jgi:hypothetical protein